MSDSCVYIADRDYGWLPATVMSQTGDQVTVKVFSADHGATTVATAIPMEERTVSLQDYPHQQLPLQNVDAAGHLMQMPDMVDLPSLHEVCVCVCVVCVRVECVCFELLCHHVCPNLTPSLSHTLTTALQTRRPFYTICALVIWIPNLIQELEI
jgi:hypothetical protein